MATAAIIYLIDCRFVAYTPSRGGKLGTMVCSICSDFRVVNGGYRGQNEFHPETERFNCYGSDRKPHQFGTLMVDRK